jgi:hypothetical protein
VLAPVQQAGELVVAVLVLDVRVGEQNGLELVARGAGGVRDVGELLEVSGDLALVPGDEDRLDVREVLVQGGAADPGLRGYPGHRHRGQPVLVNQRRRGVEGRVMHRAAVLLDRVGPQLRHQLSIHYVDS